MGASSTCSATTTLRRIPRRSSSTSRSCAAGSKGGAAQRHGQEADEGQGDQRLKELLEFLARTLVDEPDKVEVHEFEEDEDTVVLELSVAEDDRGKVIGRQGRTANALRAIMKADGTKEGKRVLVEIVD